MNINAIDCGRCNERKIPRELGLEKRIYPRVRLWEESRLLEGRNTG